VPRFTTRKRRHLPRQGSASPWSKPISRRSRPASWAIAGVSYGGTCARNWPPTIQTLIPPSSTLSLPNPALVTATPVADAFVAISFIQCGLTHWIFFELARYWGSAAAIVFWSPDTVHQSDSHLVYAAHDPPK